MGLGELPPEWQYFIYREIMKELDWEKYRKKCSYYEQKNKWCNKANIHCSFEKCPLKSKKNEY